MEEWCNPCSKATYAMIFILFVDGFCASIRATKIMSGALGGHFRLQCLSCKYLKYSTTEFLAPILILEGAKMFQYQYISQYTHFFRNDLSNERFWQTGFKICNKDMQQRQDIL